MAAAPRGFSGRCTRLSPVALCLLAGAVAVNLGVSALTLAWTHSVAKSRWEEDWHASPQGLVLAEARVQGSGAGMDPPAEARLQNGFWVWSPELPPLPSVMLRRSGATADWSICSRGRCRPMADLVPPEADPVKLIVCHE